MAGPIRKILTVLPAPENWFVLKTVDSRYWLERIVCWAHCAETETAREGILAVGGDGMPIDAEELGFDNAEFVCGADPSPTGQTWRELYEKAAAAPRPLHAAIEVTALITSKELEGNDIAAR